jgi:hypothetical protein
MSVAMSYLVTPVRAPDEETQSTTSFGGLLNCTFVKDYSNETPPGTPDPKLEPGEATAEELDGFEVYWVVPMIQRIVRYAYILFIKYKGIDVRHSLRSKEGSAGACGANPFILCNPALHAAPYTRVLC